VTLALPQNPLTELPPPASLADARKAECLKSQAPAYTHITQIEQTSNNPITEFNRIKVSRGSLSQSQE
jgi:hypothetical protein